MTMQIHRGCGATICVAFACAVLMLAAEAEPARAQQASRSTWEAADFRVWGFVPYWTTPAQVTSFSTDGLYNHVSDVIYFSGVQPREDGSLHYTGNANTHLSSLRSQAAQHGFRFHMSMFDVPASAGESSAEAVERVWNGITSNPTTRATFVNNVKNLLATNNMTGINLDWERPNTVAEWANYTQLAKDLQAALPASTEVSVDDYGFASTLWDDTPVFDAATYDQLFIMGYHYPAFGNGSLNNDNFADTKNNLTGQGAAKAFKDEQLVLGIGTWGENGPTTIGLKAIVAANPNLAGDASSYSGTIGGSTGTWEIESRYQVREKTQLALDRNMAGMMSWTLHYDAVNKHSLHRVMHHYIAFKKGVPDVNLDGRVDVTDANTLANNMGTVPGWKGTATAAQFENFYMSGNWEKGDRDGNGFVNQLDADWLADRYAALGVNLPDRLAYSGTFESFQNSQGLAGRWQGIRDAGKIRESGNYTQHVPNFLSFGGTGAGAGNYSNSAVTIRNQNSAEAFDALNTLPRIMEADLTTPIDLGQSEDTYFTFLVRQNTAPLSAAQLASDNRVLSLEFQNTNGDMQFDFSLFGKQQQFGITSVNDGGGEDVAAGGFAPDTTYLFIGKLSGNGADANTMHASLIPSGSVVGNFTDPSFPWMLTAHGSAAYNPVLTQLQFRSLYEGNFTVSNLWLGNAAAFFTPTATSLGDYNGDGYVDAADYLVWRKTMGQTGAGLVADGNGNNQIDDADYDVWRRNFGQLTSLGAGSFLQTHIPEPASVILLLLCGIIGISIRRR